MSNTIRKDRKGVSRKENEHRKEARKKCRCERCVGMNNLEAKIAEKEMTEEIRIIETLENIDFDIPKQEKILEQIMRRS